MRRHLAFSILLHALIVLVALVGLLEPRLPSPPVEVPLVVDIAAIAEKTRAPEGVKEAAKAKAPAPEPEAARPAAVAVPKPQAPAPPAPAREPPPQPVKPAAPSPKPEPVKQLPLPKPEAPAPAEPVRQAAAPPPVPSKAVAKPVPPPVPAASPKDDEPAAVAPRPRAKQAEPARASEVPTQKQPPAQKPEPAARTVAQAPERKAEPPPPRAPERARPVEKAPESPADFGSVQKAVHDLGRKSAPQPPPQAQPQAKTGASSEPRAQASRSGDPAAQSALDNQFARVMGKAPAAAAAGRDASQAMTMSEIDAVRRQIEQCWNLPPGIKGDGDLKVAIRVEMNSNGTPRAARVEGASQNSGSASFRATAESALRAVLNPRCHPFKLPAEKYDRWQTMTLVFDPKEMLGT